MNKENESTYDYVRLGRRIQARRKEIGLTQEELAEKINCSITHISRLESGSPPGLDTLIRLSYLLGYSLDEMVGLYPSPSPYVHEICDLFLVHSEDDQKFALWLIQYFFYVMDQKELDFKLRRKKSKTVKQTVSNLSQKLPQTPTFPSELPPVPSSNSHQPLYTSPPSSAMSVAEDLKGDPLS